ncbi:hypothetical protein D3C73_1438520 [compost metagenome]
MEPAITDPCVQPGPTVGGVQAGELLVGEQRLDCRVLRLLKLPLPGAFHLDPVAVQSTHEVLRGVRIQAGGVEDVPELGAESLQRRWPMPERRPGTQDIGKDLLM